MNRIKKSWAYILNCSDGTFYTGCTTNLEQRITQHKEGLYDGYTKRRRPVRLVWFEEFRDIREAIDAERQIKNWSQAKKRALIQGDIASLKDLAQSKEMQERYRRR